MADNRPIADGEIIKGKLLATIFGFWPMDEFLDEDAVIAIEKDGLRGQFTKKEINNKVRGLIEEMGLKITKNPCCHYEH